MDQQEQAVSCYKALLKTEPNDAQILYLRGEAFALRQETA